MAVDWETRNQQFVDDIKPLLVEHCFDCHQGAEADAGLALTHFKDAKSIVKERRTWMHVIRRVELGEMPPSEYGEMEEKDQQKLASWIRETLDDIDCGGTPNPGAVTLRRLNRNEYRNTIRDLLGVDYKPAKNFPGDDVGYGFDNIGDVLTLPPLLMEKYLRAAEVISQRAIVAPEPGNVFETTRASSQLKKDNGSSVTSSTLTLASRGGAYFDVQIPWHGKFKMEWQLAGDQAGDEPAIAGVFVDGKPIKKIRVKNNRESPEIFTVNVRAKAGKRRIRISFENDFYQAGGGGKPKQDRNLVVYNVRLFGSQKAKPIPESELPKSHRFLISTKPGGTISAKEATRKVLQPIASRAFRRPVSGAELDRLVNLALASQESGDSFEGSIQLGVQAVLVSPYFLFRVEEPSLIAGTGVSKIGDFELASRLSYFLWSSMPDDRLLGLASKGKLSDREIVEREVKRMILDRRANAFVENFAGQWLTLRKLDEFEPNKALYPKWNNRIRELVRRETFTFFAGVMREDMSILSLLDAEFTYLNEELANYYGIKGVKGKGFRRVSTKGYPRKGLLTQASVLAVTSNPTRTSPVKRGKWILDNLLNEPPPSAPPDVPELDKGELVGTLRERIEQHRSNPACASCHELMDPLGLAMENYDAIGLWRTKDAGERIDASGTLPNGVEVKHAGDLIKSLRIDSQDAFAKCLTEKMLTYAIGRGMEYYDRCAVDEIVSRVAAKDYRFSSLVTEIILSGPFQKKGVKE